MKSTAWSIVLAVSLCCVVAAPAFAGSEVKQVRQAKQTQQAKPRANTGKDVYILTGASRIPVPIEEVRSAIATTAIPYEVLSNH